MPNWYILINNQPAGPYSEDIIRRQIADGELLPHDMVWHERMKDWMPAGQVPGLFPNQPAFAPGASQSAGFSTSMSMTQHYAGFWKRAGAFIIDQVILGFALGIILAVVGYQPQSPLQFDPTLQLLSLLIAWPYYALLESSKRQATLGKSIFGIIVTDLDGQRISFGRASGRYFGKILSGLIIIGYFMAGFTRQKQALHDILAKCLVVNRD